jgi:hypothetical protein
LEPPSKRLGLLPFEDDRGERGLQLVLSTPERPVTGVRRDWPRGVPSAIGRVVASKDDAVPSKRLGLLPFEDDRGEPFVCTGTGQFDVGDAASVR